MSPHPMRSLNSSLGNKSSCSFHAGATSFQPSSAARVATECFVFHQENQSTGIHSSWISRLLPSAADASIHSPASTCSSFHNPNFPIIRRYLGFGPLNLLPPPLPPPPPPPLPLAKISRGDGDFRLVASFGPFKVRGMGNSAERVFGKGGFVGGEEGERVRILERKMEDETIGSPPLAFHFKSRLTRGGAGIFEEGIAGVDTVSSSRLQSCFGPWSVGSSLKIPVFDSLLASGGSGLDTARRRGAAYRALSDDGSVSRSFLDVHNLLDNVITQQPASQVRKKEAEEPFSFWNMGRFKRADFVSSVSPSFDLSWNIDRKRKSNAELNNSSSKYLRM